MTRSALVQDFAKVDVACGQIKQERGRHNSKTLSLLVCTFVNSEMKDSLRRERTFLLYESLKGNVCLYCDPLYHLRNFASNDFEIM